LGVTKDNEKGYLSKDWKTQRKTQGRRFGLFSHMTKISLIVFCDDGGESDQVLRKEITDSNQLCSGLQH
jgi:hypothetical protein